MSEQPMNHLEKKIREFAQGFEYPATPSMVRQLPSLANMRRQQRRASQIRVAAYVLGAAMVLVISIVLLRAAFQTENHPTPVVEVPSTAKGFSNTRALPPYPATLGYPDYILYQYDNTGYSVILAWKQAVRGIPQYQQVSGTDIQSFLIRQSVSRRPTFTVSNSPLHQEKLADGSTLLWQVTRYPFVR